jgi:hypothetical protein
MKKITPVALIVIIGCLLIILVAVYFIQTSKTPENENSISPPTTPSIITTKSGSVQTPVPVGVETSNESIKGPLSVSIADFNAKIPVLIDNTGLGEVSRGKPLNISVNEGYHIVKICVGDVCEQVGVEVKSGIKTTIDFGERLKKDIRQGPLTVSLGSYIAELPVFIDNMSVGNVSTGKPLNVMLSEGNHTARVCVGLICENETVEVKFAQQSIVDFGERLKKSAEFSTPTVRIVNYFITGNRLTVDAEYINPGKTDLSMTATIGVGYSYIDSGTRQRENQYGQYRFTRSVRAGNRLKQSLEMTLSGGSSTIASEPKIVEVITT